MMNTTATAAALADFDPDFDPLAVARTAIETALAGLTDLQRLEALDAIQDLAAEMGADLDADLG